MSAIASLAVDPTMHAFVCSACGRAHRSAWDLDGNEHAGCGGIWQWRKTAAGSTGCLCALARCSCAGVAVHVDAPERFRFEDAS